MERTQKSEKKRHEIVSAVRHVLPQTDYRTLSVRAICTMAHISIGTFYHHFENKEDLLAEILGEIDIYLCSEVEPSLTAATAAENLIRFAAGFAEETVKSSATSSNVLSTASVPLPSVPEMILAERQRPLYRIPCTILRQGQQSGELLTDFVPETAAAYLITCLRGYVMDWSRRNFCYDLCAAIKEFVRFYLRAISA